MAKIITLISAQPGIGKTHFGVNFACGVAALGHRTCLMNADSDVTTIQNLLNIQPRCSLEDLLKNRYTLDYLIHKGIMGVDYFPGIPGLEQIPGLQANGMDRFMSSLLELNKYDYFILDTFPGLSKNVASFAKASSCVILMMNTDTSALTDAYLFLKALTVNGFEGPVMILINKCKNVKTARSAYLKFKEAVGTYLSLKIQPLGSVFFDTAVQRAEMIKKPFMMLSPESDASKCVDNIVRHITDTKITDMAVSAFWKRFLEEMRKPFQLMVEKPVPVMKSELEKNGIAEDGTLGGHPPLTVVPNPPSTDEANASDDEVKTLLAQMQERIDALSKELRTLKRMPDPRVRFNGNQEIRIPLDFEAYMKKHVSRDRNQNK